MPKRFVSWAAVSSLPQAKKISLDEQLEVNRQHIKTREGTLIEELVVPGESRSIVLFEDACKRIEAYARLRELIEQRAFDVLIYLDRSRLGRKASLSMAVVELCHEAGIICYETESPPASLDHIHPTHDGALLGAIKSVGAQHEIDKLLHRHTYGMIGRIKRGEFPRGVPWGWTQEYQPDGSVSYEVNPVAKEILNLIADLYLSHGMSQSGIETELIRRGYKSPTGGLWKRKTLQFILERIWRYAGYTEINRRTRTGRPFVRAKGTFPPIISEETAAAISAEMEWRASSRRSVASPHLFSGVVWCEVCDKRMQTGWKSTEINGQIYTYSPFRCRYADHPRRQIASNKVLAAVRSAIEHLQVKANRETVLRQSHDEPAPLEQDIERARRHMADLDKAIERADDAFVSGTMTPERYKRQVDRLVEQVAEARKQLLVLQEQLKRRENDRLLESRLEEIADRGLQMLEHEDIPLANAWMRQHLRVWVRDNKVKRIEYL